MKIDKNITICFDTNIYDNTNYLFNGQFYTTFKNLRLYNYPNLKIYVEPIIYNEVLAHLKDRSTKIGKNVKDFKKEIEAIDLFSDVLLKLEIDNIEEQYYKEAKKKFEDFINYFSYEGIDCNFNYELTEILSDYFNGLPPFENKKNKKNEFPDALIIQHLKNKFHDQENLIIVSADKGFIESVQNKIPKSKIFTSYPACADYLNSKLEEYKAAHESIEKLICDIKDVITRQFEELGYDLFPIDYAESLGFKVDVTNYDRKGYTELYELSEVMIDNLSFTGYRIKILDTASKGERITAEIDFNINIRISGREDDSADLILENHQINYKVDVNVSTENNDIDKIYSSPILLNRNSLTNREFKRDFFEAVFDDYKPSFHPTSNTYTVTCASCGVTNEFLSEFEINWTEKGTGNDTVYFFTIDNICQGCTKPLLIEISIPKYPNRTYKVDEVHCFEGETNLSFELS
jgi:raw score 3.38